MIFRTGWPRPLHLLGRALVPLQLRWWSFKLRHGRRP